MKLIRTGSPAAEPLTLAEAKLHLKVDHDDEDGYITSLITTVRLAAEDRLQRSLISTPWQLRLDAFAARHQRGLDLPMAPVLSVQTLKYWDAGGVEQTLPATAYILVPSDIGHQLVPAPGTSWPATQSDRPAAVTVDYTAGFGVAAADVPSPIKHWMLLLMGDLHTSRRTTNVGNIVTMFVYADSLLDTYKVWSV